MCVFAEMYGGQASFFGGCFTCLCERVMNIKQTRRNQRYINKGGLFFFMMPFGLDVCDFDNSFMSD